MKATRKLVIIKHLISQHEKIPADVLLYAVDRITESDQMEYCPIMVGYSDVAISDARELSAHDPDWLKI